VIVAIEEPVEIVVWIVVQMAVVVVPMRPVICAKIVLASAVEVLEGQVPFLAGQLFETFFGNSRLLYNVFNVSPDATVSSWPEYSSSSEPSSNWSCSCSSKSPFGPS